MPYIADRVQETTTTTGTDTVTLEGAVSGYRTFKTAFGGPPPLMVQYLLVSGTAWEVGKGFFDGNNKLTRESVRTSSNNNAKITLAGTSNVYCTASAELLDNANIGLIYAQARGYAMP